MTLAVNINTNMSGPDIYHFFKFSVYDNSMMKNEEIYPPLNNW